ncbi:hypothetical protein AAG612_14065 [Citromicrobium bathyomarinum]
MIAPLGIACQLNGQREETIETIAENERRKLKAANSQGRRKGGPRIV